MTAKGQVIEHPMFAKALGAGAASGATSPDRPGADDVRQHEDPGRQLFFYLGEESSRRTRLPTTSSLRRRGADRRLQDKLEVIGHEATPPRRRHDQPRATAVARLHRYLKYDRRTYERVPGNAEDGSKEAQGSSASDIRASV